jgi:hypothetical protein
MLGGDAYRVPSNIHFHIACMTETCMPSRYTLKTLPENYPVQVFVLTPLSLLNVMSIVSVTVLPHRIQSSGKHFETCNVCIAVQMLYHYCEQIVCLLHNERPYITVSYSKTEEGCLITL